MSQRFHSFEEAQAADDAYYASLPPDERVAILLDIIAAHQEAAGVRTARLERVWRVVELLAR